MIHAIESEQRKRRSNWADRDCIEQQRQSYRKNAQRDVTPQGSSCGECVLPALSNSRSAHFWQIKLSTANICISTTTDFAENPVDEACGILRGKSSPMNCFPAKPAFMLAILAAVGSATIAAPPVRVFDESATDRFAEVRQLIHAKLSRDRIPSVAVSVAHHGEIIWEQGFGFANREEQLHATPHTVYRICSIAKAFTGTAVMILVERNRLDLDRPVNDYLGPAQLRARVGHERDATVRRLANHTSGLPTHDQFFFAGERYQQTSDDQIETQITRYGNIVWKPGERTEYSNLAMGILSHIVSRQTGISFPEFMKNEVFLPLGMTHSSVGTGDALNKVTAVAYFDGKPLPEVTTVMAGAGDIWCSSHDLVRFAMFHLKDHRPDQKRVLTDQSIDETQRSTGPAPGAAYGVGWGIDNNYRGTGYRAVGHHGGNVGWHSLLLLIPAEDLAVAVLVNSAGNVVDSIADQVIATVVPDFHELRLAALAQRVRDEHNEPKETDVRHNTDSLSQIVGRWQGTVDTYEGSLPVEFECDQSGIAHIQIGDQPRTKLTSLAFKKGVLTADLSATILTTDTRRQLPGVIEVDLTLRGDRLTGVFYANSLFGNPAWGGYRLNHWVNLNRTR